MSEFNDINSNAFGNFEGTAAEESSPADIFGRAEQAPVTPTPPVEPVEPVMGPKGSFEPKDPAEFKGEPDKKDNKKLLWIGIGVAIVAIVVCALLFMPGSKEEHSPEPAVEAVVPAEEPAAKVQAAQPAAQPASKPAQTSNKLDYGQWSGAWKGGKPNGVGTMRYTKSHLIDSRDPQHRTAEKGDYIIGEFVDGKLVQGVWYDSANNVKGSIIIGM